MGMVGKGAGFYGHFHLVMLAFSGVILGILLGKQITVINMYRSQICSFKFGSD